LLVPYLAFPSVDMSATMNRRTALVLIPIAALSAGCAEPGAKQMTAMTRTSTSAEADGPIEH
jgi:hypothetical protein